MTLKAGRDLTIGGNMTLKAGKDLTIAGSQAEASGEATLEAGRNINILSVEQLKKIYEKEESINVSGGGINNIDFSQIERGRISVELGKGEMRGDDYEEWTIKQAGSSVKAGGKVKATAGGDVNIKGSKVEGEEIEIEAENINIITADNKNKRKETHKDASVTVSAGITNSFVDAYYAGDALVKASEMHARAESELSKIEKLYDNGRASKEAVEDAKLNVTLARVNLASATTNAIASAAGAMAEMVRVGSEGKMGVGDFELDMNKLKVELEKREPKFNLILKKDEKDLMNMITQGKRGQETFVTPMSLQMAKAFSQSA